MNQVVLVHGSWHGSWVWEPLQRRLDALGISHSAVSLPSMSRDAMTRGDLADDVRVVEQATAQQSSVVLAHSYGGLPVTQAQLAPGTKIVYLAAFVPAEGMSLVAHFPELPPYVDLDVEAGTSAFRTELARDVLYHDVEPDLAAWATARLVPQAASAVTTPLDHASWRSHPSTYIVCTDDHTVPVDAQRMFATRCEWVVELPTSHSPMLSAPDKLAQVVIDQI